MQDVDSVSQLAQSLRIEFEGSRVFLDGEDVSEGIRTPTVTKAIRAIADNPRVREYLVAAQRAWTQGKKP